MKDELENLKKQIEGYKALIEIQRSELWELRMASSELEKTKNLLHGYKKVTGETTVALAKAGVETGTGSAYNIALSNALEKRLQENLIYYNSRVAAANKREEASFARIKGQIAKQESKLAQISTIASAGTTLLRMGGGSSYKDEGLKVAP